MIERKRRPHHGIVLSADGDPWTYDGEKSKAKCSVYAVGGKSYKRKKKCYLIEEFGRNIRLMERKNSDIIDR